MSIPQNIIIKNHKYTTKDKHVKKQKGKKKCPYTFFLLLLNTLTFYQKVKRNQGITKSRKGAKYILGYKIQSKLIMIVLYPRNLNIIQITLKNVFRLPTLKSLCLMQTVTRIGSIHTYFKIFSLFLSTVSANKSRQMFRENSGCVLNASMAFLTLLNFVHS